MSSGQQKLYKIIDGWKKLQKNDISNLLVSINFGFSI